MIHLRPAGLGDTVLKRCRVGKAGCSNQTFKVSLQVKVDFVCFAAHNWGVLSPQGIPHQKNDSDCGVFVLEVTDSPPSSLSLQLFSSFPFIIDCYSSKGSGQTPQGVYFQPVGLSVDVDYLQFYLSVSCSQYCRRLSMKQPLHFSQEDMPGIRKRIYKELCDYGLND